MITEIQSNIRAIEENAGLRNEVNFNDRADAIDFLDFHIIERIEGLPPHPELVRLKQLAQKIKRELEEIDTNLFIKLREGIRQGVYTKSSFKEMICEYVSCDEHESGVIGYNNLDVFINGLLSNQPIPEPTTERAAEMVFYQKTPARIVFELAERVKLNNNDVFFDIGSGLGQVTLLVNLISGTATKGIEFEPAYCDYAKECAAKLNLTHVEFINADALVYDYSRGTVFFLYTPFEGNMLQQMLDILEKASLKRMIRIFTYGPCSPIVARQNWLSCENGNGDDFYKLYEFKSL